MPTYPAGHGDAREPNDSMKEYNPEDTVEFTNIDSEEFECRYDGKLYQLGAGEKRTFRLPVAQHFAKHLADKILQRGYDAESKASKDPLRRNRARLWMDPKRAELYGKMIPELAEGLKEVKHSAEELEVQLDKEDQKREKAEKKQRETR